MEVELDRLLDSGRDGSTPAGTEFDAGAESFLRLEERLDAVLGPDADSGVAYDAERVPASEVPDDYPLPISGDLALALTLELEPGRTRTVYVDWPASPSDTDQVEALLAAVDASIESFGDLYGEAVPLTRVQGHSVPAISGVRPSADDGDSTAGGDDGSSPAPEREVPTHPLVTLALVLTLPMSGFALWNWLTGADPTVLLGVTIPASVAWHVFFASLAAWGAKRSHAGWVLRSNLARYVGDPPLSQSWYSDAAISGMLRAGDLVYDPVDQNLVPCFQYVVADHRNENHVVDEGFVADPDCRLETGRGTFALDSRNDGSIRVTGTTWSESVTRASITGEPTGGVEEFVAERVDTDAPGTLPEKLTLETTAVDVGEAHVRGSFTDDLEPTGNAPVYLASDSFTDAKRHATRTLATGLALLLGGVAGLLA